MKQCRICHEQKEKSSFVKNKTCKEGIDTICLECSRNKVKEHRKKNKTPRSTTRKSSSSVYRDIIVDFLIKRDGLICPMCGTSMEGSVFHIDHMLPLALGGKDIMENVRLTHPKCNMSQSNEIRKQKYGY